MICIILHVTSFPKWASQCWFAAHPIDISIKRVCISSLTHTLTGTLPPPDIRLAQTCLPLPFLPTVQRPIFTPHRSSTSELLYPFQASSYHAKQMGPAFPPPSSLLPSFLVFPSLSFSPSLFADERQALSLQWHSKTSGLGSSVSGYSTLLGAISISKVWPAHSPTEKPSDLLLQSPHRRETQLLLGCNGCLHVCKDSAEINRDEQADEVCVWASQRNSHVTVALWGREKAARCFETEWERLHVLQIYEDWVSYSLGCIFLKFPHKEAKRKARRQSPSHQ